MTNFWRKFYQDPFKRYLTVSLVILGVVLLFTGYESTKPPTNEGFEVHFFYLTGCSHCDEQNPFNEELASKYPSINFIYHDAAKPEESALLSEMLASVRIEGEPEFPVTIFGGVIFDGWESKETTGEQIEKALQQCLTGGLPGNKEGGA